MRVEIEADKGIEAWCGWRKGLVREQVWRLKKAIDGNLGCQNINRGASDCWPIRDALGQEQLKMISSPTTQPRKSAADPGNDNAF